MRLSDINQSMARPSRRIIYTDTANIRTIVNDVVKPQSPMLEGRGFEYLMRWINSLVTSETKPYDHPDVVAQLPQVLEGSGHSYSCVMFNLNNKDADRVLAWSKKNIPNDVLFTDGEKGREDKIHVTVLYGLHGNDPKDVAKIVKKFKPSDISFGEITKFESGKYDVIKI